MKLYKTFLAAALVAGAFVPVAAADQYLEAGPAHVRTQNYGDGDCASDGFSYRGAAAWTNDTGLGAVGVDVVSYCRTTSWGDTHVSQQRLFVIAYRDSGGASGPFLVYDWDAYQYESAWGNYTYCQGTLIVSGPQFYTGCPNPDGSGAPLLPALP